ncbi:restriction endonuclease subunit S [Marimonas arenosa]|uniref:Restriction endonuclease subunit S n=1 Tax=Marimonas arenosa TaxID=1795305 RepID=A0AAE3WFI1_9RHOB|nr:restriction endonuclease subunit S [Marimonas arenosa]MDQ2092311.1 restriction endonuclease subunit S [Marimonas arenosa]
MSELPKTWTEAEIGELCDLINGRAFKPSDWTEDGLPIVRIQNLNNPDKPFNRFDGEVRERFLIESGDLLFAWSGTPGTSFGAHVWNGGPAVLNQHIFNVKFNRENLDRDFFRHAINQKLNELIDKAHGGVGLRHVTKGKFEETKISLPPLPEQRRIVRKLDTLSARTTTARTHLSAIAKLVGKYKKGVLEAAFSNHGPLVTIGSLIDGIKAGKNLKCDERPPREGEQGTVKVSAVSWGEFRPDQSKTFPSHFEPDPDTAIKPGDFLFSRANTIELVGAVVIVDTTPDNLFLSDKVLRLDMASHLKPWLLWFLRSPQGRKQLEEVSSGNQMSMRNIGQAKLKSLLLPLPNEAERDKILRQIEANFAKIDLLAAEAEKALKLTDRLDQRILAKAFAGELVPQDPTDEPASILLDRIRAERASAPKPKRGRRKKADAAT